MDNQTEENVFIHLGKTDFKLVSCNSLSHCDNILVLFMFKLMTIKLFVIELHQEKAAIVINVIQLYISVSLSSFVLNMFLFLIPELKNTIISDNTTQEINKELEKT